MKKIIILTLAFCFSFTSLQGEAVEKLVILGGGPAGLTASLFAAQLHLDPLVIEGDPHEGQITSVYCIENFPGFPEGISGDELAKKIRQQAAQFGARFQLGQAVKVDLLSDPFQIVLQDGKEITCESVVIATGASPRWLGIENESELIGFGLSANAVLDAPKFKDKTVIVVGSGDSAMEQALLLSKESNEVVMILKEEKFSGADYLQERVLKNPKIQFIFNAEVIAIQGIEEKQVSGVTLKNVNTGNETALFCEGIFVAKGRKPNTELFLNQIEMSDKGYILTQPNSTVTSRPGVFAAGDVVQSSYRKVVTSVASGGMSAIDAKKFLKEKEGW
jgi:thioredoxin reductase (NADPH)